MNKETTEVYVENVDNLELSREVIENGTAFVLLGNIGGTIVSFNK